MFEPLAGHVEVESCSNGSLKLVEREAHLEVDQSESSAGFEEKHVRICILDKVSWATQGASTVWNVAGTFFFQQL